MLNAWLDAIANAAFVIGTLAILFIAFAALVATLGRDSENDQ